MAIKLLIADDHALLRQGIRMVLELDNEFEIICETSNGQETLAKTLLYQPDVILLDLNMPILNGIEVAKHLQAAKSKSKIIMLTIHDDDNYVIEVLKYGVKGYLLKDVETNVLAEAIRTVYEGGTYIYPEIAEKLFGTLAPDIDADYSHMAEKIWRERRGERLTSREMEVLQCIAKGFNNQEIAQALFVSEKTVKNHLTNIFRKLNVNDRTQALLYALKKNMITVK